MTPTGRKGAALGIGLLAFMFGVPWLGGTPLGSSMRLVTGQGTHGTDAVAVVPAPAPGQRKVVLEQLGMT